MAKAAKQEAVAAKSATENENKKQSLKVIGYRITSKADGFRRGGIVHAGVREYGLDELSESQLAAIEAEPLLILERLEVTDEETA